RFFASCSALSLVSRSCLRRFSSSALRASAASRSVRSAASRRLRTNASSSALLRSSASRRPASLSARARAFCSSSVRLRNTMPPDGLGAGGDVVWVVAAAAGAAVLPVVARLAGAGVGPSGLARGGARAFYFSPHTLLGAAMSEALAHHALLDAPPFQGQGLARGDAQLLFASFFRRFSHSNPNSELAPRFIMFPPRTSAALPA